MASSLYNNPLHVDFESFLAMYNPGMVSVFNTLMASGLEDFLGCPAVLYEAALVDFFNNGSVRDGLVVSTVNGVPVEFKEQLLAESFELPVDGLSELSEIPRDQVFDTRSIVSMSGEPVSLSGKKSQMKIEYRLLCDIMTKSISVKAGSFNAITVDKFSLLSAVVCGVRMNWASVLFNILKKMVTAGSKQGKGFAVQIIGAQEAIDAPKVKKAPRKRPAVAIADEPEAVPIQMIEPISAAPAAGETFEQPATEDEITADQPADEVTGYTIVEEAVAASVDVTAENVDEQMAEPSADVETIVEEFAEPAVDVIAETAQMEPAEEDIEVDASADEDQPAGTTAEKHWFDLSYEDLIAKWDAERKVVTPSDTDEETEAEKAAGTIVEVQPEFFQPECFVEEPEDMEMSDDERLVDTWIDAYEGMPLEDILMTIPVEAPLPSARVEFTKITLGKEIEIPGVDERTWYLASLPQIPVDVKGKELLVERDPMNRGSKTLCLVNPFTLATSPHDPLGITNSACKNHSVIVSVQYGSFNTNIPIRSTTIGKSRVSTDPITMHTSWRSNSDIACVTSIGYPHTKASGKSSTTKHRLLHASGPHPIPTPDDPN
ncbi:dystroglycan-like [Dorcoceras hygrometricum]|uniref:Dystroglycan-like n=1 Tax=Dorcoceras hygrometricum TaxID=472368 RepID=A0A2Z7CL43_9LAMI|nr:dystroglycan-like [Dorcoceras hygrometricum]